MSTSMEEPSDVAQAVSDTYAKRFGIERDAAWYLAKMTEEMGELHAAYRKHAGRGWTERWSETRVAMENAFADALSILLPFARW